jgi:hypothetical protein
MEHEHPAPSPLDRTDVLRALWASLGTNGRRALRECCTAVRDAVDAHASGLVGPSDAEVLSPAACARLSSVNAITLRTMACLRGMLVDQPGAFFPRLQSLRLLLHVVGRRSGARRGGGGGGRPPTWSSRSPAVGWVGSPPHTHTH